MTTRVAAIGVCHWHSLYDAAYLRHLDTMDDVEIVGIHDADADIAAHRAGEVGGSPPTFTDYRRMLTEVEPDFVLALGPHNAMAATAHHLLDEGIPFIMEKPMSYDARELLTVVEKADALGGFAAVPLSNRYLPIIAMAKEWAEDETFGPITHFYARMNRPTSRRYPPWGSEWMLDPKVSNGGCLRNLGSHGLDAFVYLTGEGEEIDVVGAQLSWAVHRLPVEDYASVLLRSRKGVLGTVEVGNGFPRDGTDGEWKVAFRDAILTFKDDVLKLNTGEGEETIPSGGPDIPAPQVLRETIEAAARGDSPPIGVRDCYRAVRLIDAAYAAASSA